MKTIKKTDHVSMVFGEWNDRTYGNTYYDISIRINDLNFTVAWQYGYGAGSAQSIEEGLKSIGYRLRTCNADQWRPLNAIHYSRTDKLKRNLHKNTGRA